MKRIRIPWGPVAACAAVLGVVVMFTYMIKPHWLSSGETLDVLVIDKTKTVTDKDPFESNPRTRYMLNLGYKPKNPGLELGSNGLKTEYAVPVDIDIFNSVEIDKWYSMRIYPGRWEWHVYEVSPPRNR